MRFLLQDDNRERGRSASDQRESRCPRMFIAANRSPPSAIPGTCRYACSLQIQLLRGERAGNKQKIMFH